MFANLRDALGAVALRFGKGVQVAETDYLTVCNGTWSPVLELSDSSVPVSAEGQREWVWKVVDVVKGVPGGLGQGGMSTTFGAYVLGRLC